MPLALGGAALAFIFLSILTLVTVYWVLTQWHNFVQNIPVLGGPLRDTADYLRDRNLELITAVANVAHSLISWSIDRIHDGFTELSNIATAVITSQVNQAIATVSGLENWVNTFVNANITALNLWKSDIENWRVSFVDANIAAFNQWKDWTTNLLNNTVVPGLAGLTVTTGVITNILLPKLRADVDASTQATILLDRNSVQPLKQEMANLSESTAIALSAPGVGVIPRVGKLEQDLAIISAWAAAIGISIPIAANLARVGRNPCTCLTEQGQTDVLPLLMYLFEEAG